ncbi:MAG: HAD-IIIA family hydrolase [Cyclobacteriaceae bacterium]
MKHNIKFLILDVDGTMTDGGIYITEEGHQFKKFSAKDGLGIKIAMKSGIDVGIISHSYSTEMVSKRANMLGMKYVYIGQQPKLQILEEWLTELDLQLNEIAYIGDDLNDLDIMEKVGFKACPSDATETIKQICDVVLTNKGGEGAVREFIDKHLLGK